MYETNAYCVNAYYTLHTQISDYPEKTQVTTSEVSLGTTD